MRFHVRHPGAGRPREHLQRADLVGHLVRQLARGHVHGAPPEAGQVAVGDLRADPYAPLGGQFADPAHDGRIPGVETAGHVGARHDGEQGLVVGERPAPEALAEVCVEVDRRRGRCDHGRHAVSVEQRARRPPDGGGEAARSRAKRRGVATGPRRKPGRCPRRKPGRCPAGRRGGHRGRSGRTMPFGMLSVTAPSLCP